MGEGPPARSAVGASTDGGVGINRCLYKAPSVVNASTTMVNAFTTLSIVRAS